MTPVGELDLPFLRMEDPAFAEDPYPYFAKARSQHPWLAKCSFGYVAHEYSAAKELLRMDGPLGPNFRAKVDMLGVQGTPWGRFQVSMMLATSGPPHKKIRDQLAMKFTPRLANQNRPLMREVISKLLDEWAPRGAFDFEEFAAFFPITVMCRMIGASPDVLPSLRTSLEDLGLGSSLDKSILPRLQNAIGVMDSFVQKLVADRRAAGASNRQADMLDTLLEKDAGLTDRELFDLLILLFIAGYDTSKNMLTLTMMSLLDQPLVYARCAEDLDYCARVIDESFRFKSTATIPRVTNTDVEFRDVLLPKGTMLFMPVSIVGRDPIAFPEPEKFDPDRDQTNRHIAFGMGMHMCLGQHIARAQIAEGFHLIAKRLKNPRRTAPSGSRPFFGTWGIRGLPISFDQEPAAVAT